MLGKLDFCMKIPIDIVEMICYNNIDRDGGNADAVRAEWRTEQRRIASLVNS